MSKNYDKKIISDLEKLGLEEKDSKVYIALLEIGEVGSTKIVQRTGLHRQYVYQSLGRLEELGLVTHSIVKNRKRFLAQNPQTLLALLKEKEAVANSVIKELQSHVQISDRSNIHVHKGFEMFIQGEFERLKELKNGAVIDVIGGEGDKYIKTHGKYFEEYEYQRKKKNITVRYIGNAEQSDYLNRSSEERPLFKFKQLPGAFKGTLTSAIFDDIYVQYLFQDPVTLIVIKNIDVVNGYRSFYEMLWKLAK